MALPKIMNMKSGDALHYVENWLKRRIDGEWEHHNWVLIQTTDNPGWMVRIKAAGEFPMKGEIVPVDLSTENTEGLISKEGLAMFSKSLDCLLLDLVKVLKLREELMVVTQRRETGQ